MQKIIIEKPYQFIPPHRGSWVPSLIQRFRLVDAYLKRVEGIHSHEVRNSERLIASLRDGAGVLLAPNHCRYADPLAMGWIAREADIQVYAMASWHLFHQHWLQAFAIRMCGGFSVNREGLDRQSLDTAVQTLVDAERPLVLFAEGTVVRSNDRLSPLLDGVSFIARTAARRRAKADGGRVVIHPVAIKYLFRGDAQKTIEPVLSGIEKRITWDECLPPDDLLERLQRVGEALFSLKEIQFLGSGQRGSLAERKSRLIERLLDPLDAEWFGRPQDLGFMPRIKQLRTQLVPQLQDPATAPERRTQIWQQLSDIYCAQQIWSYPEGYLEQPTDTRLIETIERFEEDLTDRATIHQPWHAVMEIGEAIEVAAAKPRKGEGDALTDSLSGALSSMLQQLSTEAQPWPA